MDETRRDWSIMTKAYNGTVSVVRDLTLSEAKQMYERLDPYYGHRSTQYVYEHDDGNGTTHFSGTGAFHHVSDGDIELREVFGPPDWNPEEVHSWSGQWPKITHIKVDKNGDPIDKEGPS